MFGNPFGGGDGNSLSATGSEGESLETTETEAKVVEAALPKVGHITATLCAMADELGPVQGARPGRKASDIMREMAATMDERNDVYKDNWRMIGPMLKILFPNGVPSELVTQDFWHLFELMLVKVARFASTNCTHVDSIHDAGAYCGFVQLAIEESLKEKK